MADKVTLSPETVEILKKARTGVVIDALGMAGLQGGVKGIYPARGFEDEVIVGLAATLLFAPARQDTPKRSTYHVVRECPPGSVMVIDGQGQDGHFVGDNVAEYAKRQGVVALVVNGAARDLIGFREVGMPLYCTGLATRPNTLQLTDFNVPVEMGGVLVKPGDVIVADEDGVAVIPSSALDTVLQKIGEMFDIEAGMKEVILRDGSPEEIATIMARKKKK